MKNFFKALTISKCINFGKKSFFSLLDINFLRFILYFLRQKNLVLTRIWFYWIRVSESMSITKGIQVFLRKQSFSFSFFAKPLLRLSGYWALERSNNDNMDGKGSSEKAKSAHMPNKTAIGKVWRFRFLFLYQHLTGAEKQKWKLWISIFSMI